ncbi:hypothetical protein ABI_39680 [Asticcacaulis biprosthecium C19]|uniref:Beta-barrel assembly machine subunit BamF n=1 Tax=Asticcacaulis biprosthecium C19 TaxID=715226 RepID=F4QS32_9CAUL|nr:DUF3035 domain-containing protein [Asticcacaulis biprosthecium]EGF89552.1 hypothetical protein ABI_39680 [Asticcacaulis biprosthecium C19]
MKSLKVAAGLALLAGLGLTGCESTKSALGLNKVVPDEFRVVTKAPLVVPPDYALRPPAPGEPRPQELQPESAARQALLGQRDAVNRTQGEQLFVAQAGAEKADPLARYVVDDEFGDLTYKDASFADTVLFWRKKDTTVAGSNTAIGAEVAQVDAVAEAERVKALTGEQPIVIAQKKERKFKLPGL